MRFGRWLYLILAVTLLGSMGAPAAQAGPLAVFTNFRGGFAPSTVTIIDTATDQLVGNPIPVGVNPAGVAITPDGKTAVVACAESQDVYFIDLSASPPKLIGRLDVGTGLSAPFYPVGVAMSPDGAYAALTVGINASAVPRVAPGNTYVRVVSVKDRSIVQSIQMPQDQYPITAEAAAFSPQGSIVIAGPQTSLIYALAFSGGEILLPEGSADQFGAFQGTAATNVAITPDGQTALLTAASTKIAVFPVDSTGRIGAGSLVSSGGSGAQAIALTRDGKRAFVRNFYSPGNNVAVFDITGTTLKDTGLRLQSSGFPGEILALVPEGNLVGIPTIAITPDGRKVYTTNPFLPQGVEVFEVDKPQPIRRFSAGSETIGVAIQPQ